MWRHLPKSSNYFPSFCKGCWGAEELWYYWIRNFHCYDGKISVCMQCIWQWCSYPMNIVVAEVFQKGAKLRRCLIMLYTAKIQHYNVFISSKESYELIMLFRLVWQEPFIHSAIPWLHHCMWGILSLVSYCNLWSDIILSCSSSEDD